jgi:hypothetical protein
MAKARLSMRDPPLFRQVEVTKQSRRRRSHFDGPAKAPGNKRLIPMYPVKQRGSVMWDVIISLIYQQCCRNYVAAARKQRNLDHLWA